MKNKNVVQLLFYGALIYLMVLSLNLAIRDSSGMILTTSKLSLYSAATSIAAMVLVFYPIAFILGVTAFSTWLLYMLLKHSEAITTMLVEASHFISWMYGYIVGYNAFLLKHTVVFLLLYSIFAALVISLFVRMKRGGFVLIVAGTIAHAFFWFIYVERARLYLMLFLFAAILLYSYKVFQSKCTEWSQLGSSEASNLQLSWLLNSSLIIGAAIALTLVLPLNFKAVQWHWLNDSVADAFPFILEWKNDAFDSYSYGFKSRYSSLATGFKEGKLGGEIIPDNSIMLDVESAPGESFYLRGVVKDNYTGNSWGKGQSSYAEYRAEQVVALPYSKAEVRTYKRTFKITPQKLVTSTIFAPYHIKNVDFKDRSFFIDQDSEAYFSRQVIKNDSYSVEAEIPYLNEALLRGVGITSFSSLKHLQLPNSISRRVYDLAREITKSHKTNYDKAKAIEKYLRQNYKYNLKPAALPQNREFVDHFLFDSKSGYCTYFATSMAVMLRAVGIPCRYVEGFVIRGSNTSKTNVRGSDAHAWVEVNFGRFGWVTFEPTPAYNTPSIDRPFQNTAEVQPTIPAFNPSGEVQTPAGREKNLGEDEPDGAKEDESTVEAKTSPMRGIGFTMLFLLFLRIFTLYAVEKLSYLKMKRLKSKEFIAMYIQDALWHLKKLGFKMDKDETIRQFYKRANYNLLDQMDHLNEVTELIERLRYGNAEVDASERRMLLKSRDKLRKIARKRLGSTRLFVHAYIIGRPL